MLNMVNAYNEEGVEREERCLRRPRRCSSFVDLAAGFVVRELRDLAFGFGNSAGHLQGVYVGNIVLPHRLA